MYYGYTEKVKKANLQEVRYQSETLQSSKYSLNKLEKAGGEARWGCNGTKEGFRGTFTQDQQEILRVLHGSARATQRLDHVQVPDSHL